MHSLWVNKIHLPKENVYVAIIYVLDKCTQTIPPSSPKFQESNQTEAILTRLFWCFPLASSVLLAWIRSTLSRFDSSASASALNPTCRACTCMQRMWLCQLCRSLCFLDLTNSITNWDFDICDRKHLFKNPSRGPCEHAWGLQRNRYITTVVVVWYLLKITTNYSNDSCY